MSVDPQELARVRRLLPRVTERMALDLRGLVVLTEAASGPYLWTPALAATAGAERVVALARDSRFHRARDVRADTLAAASALGVGTRVEIVGDKRPQDLAAADVVTNTAGLRPITAGDVAQMKPTAALALMWETWEFRPEDLDLDACRRRGILVLGTHERRPPCDLVPYMGFLALRLLFALGLEGHGTSVLLLGRQALGREMERFLRSVGCDVETFSAPGDGGRPYAELAGHVEREAGRHDAVIVAEHVDRRPLLGPDGIVTPAALAAGNPAIRVGVVSGGVDAAALRDAGLRVVPGDVRGGGYMSFDASVLGPRPILELHAAGLAVGAAAARARLDGLDVARAAARAIATSPAMDFDGPLAWAR